MRAIKSFSSLSIYVVCLCSLFIGISLNAQCPTIGSLADPGDICAGDNFDLVASGLDNMAIGDNSHSQNFGIDFVHFGPGGTATNSYIGGTSLGIVPFASLTGTDPNQIASLTGVGAGLAPGTYTIYANISPTPTEPSCVPQQNILLVVLPDPSGAVTAATGTDPDLDVDADPYTETICSGSIPVGTHDIIEGDYSVYSAVTVTGLTGSAAPTPYATIANGAVIETGTLVNAGTSTVSATYTICTFGNGPDGATDGVDAAGMAMDDDCTGNCYTYTVNVLPEPSSTSTDDDGDTNPLTETICSGETPESLHDLLAGDYAIYKSISNPGGVIGLAAAVNGIIPDGSIIETGTLLNSGTTSATITYEICSFNNGIDGIMNGVDAAGIANPDDCAGSCYSYAVTVLSLPTISVTGSTTICEGDAAPDFVLTGTPGETVMYTINGVSQSVIIPVAGTIAIPASNTITQTLTLVSVSGCSADVAGSATVTVQPLPTISLSVSSSSVCEGDDPSSTFNITGGPANGSITYNIGGADIMVALDMNGEVMIPASNTASTTLTITLVSESGMTVNCSAVVDISETITHFALPTITSITGGTICSGDPALSFVIEGTPNAIVNYTKTTGGVPGTPANITLNATGSATLLGSNTATCIITLNSITSAVADGSCTANLTNTATITVNENPIIAISDQTICNTVTAVSLAGLEPTGQTGGAWSNAVGIITTPANVDPSTGPFTYTYTDTNGCSSSVDVIYNLVDDFDAGIDGTITVCNEDPTENTFDLFDELGGSPDPGGTWAETTVASLGTTASGATTTGPAGTISFQGVAAGVYEFTYQLTGGCGSDNSTVSVTVTNCFDLSLSKSLTTVGVIENGDDIEFEITVTNDGPVDAYDIIVNDAPGCLTYTSAVYKSHTGGGFTPVIVDNMTASEFEISYLPAGESVTITVSMKIACSTTTATNYAEIKSASTIEGGGMAIDEDSPNGNNSINEDDDDTAIVMISAPLPVCSPYAITTKSTCNSNGRYDLEVCFTYAHSLHASNFVNISINGALEEENYLTTDGMNCITIPNVAVGDGSSQIQVLIEEVSTFRISEFHYDNDGGDVNEFIEISGLAGANLAGYEIALYSLASGGAVTLYDDFVLSGVIGDEGNGCGSIVFTPSTTTGFSSLQNDTEGIALIDAFNNVVEFISYEGSFSATIGGQVYTSVDVGITEEDNASFPVTHSLQLNNLGVWTAVTSNSAGLLNPGVSCPTNTSLTGCFNVARYNEPECEVVCFDLACNNKVQVSLSNNCEECISPDMILEGDHEDYEQYTVSIDSAGVNIGDCVNLNHAGAEYKVSVSCGENSCWGIVRVEDKLPPLFANCNAIQANLELQLGTSLSCADLNEDWDVIVDLPDSIIIECNNDFTVTTEQGLTGDMCTDDYRWTKRYIIDYPVAHGGRDTAHACIISLPVEPIGLNEIICPDDQLLGCRETNYAPDDIYAYWISSSGGDTTAAFAISQAYPYLTSLSTGGHVVRDTVRLTSEHCNILSNYTDTELPICQFQRKLIRKWTFIDWCTSQVRTCDQVIKLIDNESMICVAPPEFDVPLGAHCLIDSTVLPTTISRGELVVYAGCGNVIDTTIYYKSKANTREGIDDLPFTLKAIEKADGSFILPPIEVPFDSIWLKYEFTNACGEVCSAFTEARVIDNTPPTPVCNPDIAVAFSDLERGNDGLMKIYADAFNADSHDNSCGEVYFKILRVAELNGSTDGYWNNSGQHGAPDYKVPPINNRNNFCDGANEDDFGNVTLNGSELVNTGNQFWFDDHIKLCCTDDNFMVVMRVFDIDPGDGPIDPRRMHSETTFITGTTDVIVNDLYGHFNDCMIELNVQDKTQILGACQPFSLFCDEYPDNPMDHAPEINMLCSDENVRLISKDSTNITECGNGLVIRDWYAKRGSGEEVKVCTQSIVLQSRAFNPYSLKWPKSYVDGTETGRHFYKDENDICMDSIYQVPMGGALDCSDNVNSCEPTWDNTACSLLGLSSKDDTLFVDGDACMKIIRTWSVIDWCLYNENTSRDNSDNSDRFEPIKDDCDENCDPNNVYFRFTDVDMDGFYTYQQVLKIVDDQAPTLTGCSTKNVGITEGCATKLKINKTATDGTGCGQSFLKWIAVLSDTSGNTLGTYPGVTDNPGTFEVETRTVSPGVYNVQWFVEDACGNESTCEEQYIVTDDKAPTPICVRDLSTVLMPSTGSIEIWASDYNLKSEDNCVEPRYSFFPDSIQANQLITCDDMDGFAAKTFSYKIYVVDNAGNSDFCVVSLRVDAKEICGGDGEGGSSAIIQGDISTENGDMVGSAEVFVNAALPEYPVRIMTENNGSFAFVDNPLAYDYDISIKKDGDDVNGVSTLDIVLIQKHILGLQDLGSPYKVIAADANGDQRVSAGDLVQIRKLILGVSESYPNNTSWRFVDAGQSFENNLNPWPFVEVINIGNLNNDMMDEDFVGVKIGDVNGNVSANSKSKAEVRSAGKLSFNIDDRAVKAGEIFNVEFSSKDFEEVQGYQMTLSHPGLVHSGVLGEGIELTSANVASFDDYLTMSWNGSAGANGVLFTLSFIAEQDLRLSEVLSINSRLTVAEAYVTDALNTYDLVLNTTSDIEPLAVETEFVLHQNQPNPFVGETTISFMLPEANEATLTIMDVTGKLIMRITDLYEKGYNEVSLRSDEIQTSGIIYYQLESGKYQATKKMIVID